jgi:hypothetical protein
MDSLYEDQASVGTSLPYGNSLWDLSLASIP